MERSGTRRLGENRLGRWRSIAQRTVRSELIVLPSPAFDENLCLPQRVEDLTVEKLIPEFAIERLIVAVLPRAAGLDEQRLDIQLLQPRVPTRNSIRPDHRRPDGESRCVEWGSRDKEFGLAEGRLPRRIETPGFRRTNPARSEL